MSESRQCCYCQRPGMAPDILPFLADGKGHYWAHSQCEEDVRQAKRARDLHENGDGV